MWNLTTFGENNAYFTGIDELPAGGVAQKPTLL